MREQRRLLELALELLLRTVVQLGEILGQTDDLERALPEVVRLLGVEQQDPVRHLHLGHHDGDHRPARRAPRSAARRWLPFGVQ